MTIGVIMHKTPVLDRMLVRCYCKGSVWHSKTAPGSDKPNAVVAPERVHALER
jgi:hypothetical protein